MSLVNKLYTERLFFCGSMGTMLEPLLKPGELPEVLNITKPEAICNIHTAYINAGANLIKTNTFGANCLKLSKAGHTVEEVVKAAVYAAKLAAGDSAFIALSVGPLGKMIKPVGDMPLGEAVEIFAEPVIAGAKAGADMILIETMGDTCEIKAAMLAAKENSALPIAVTFTLDKQGRLFTGGDILTAVSLIEHMGADLIGLNCGFGVEQSLPQLQELFEHTNLPIIFNPNAGLPQLVDGKTIYNTTPAEYAQHMQAAAPYARIMGGCCGTRPEHIMAMIEKCGSVVMMPIEQKVRVVISSYNKAVVLGESTIYGKPIVPSENIQDDVLDSVDDGAEVVVLDLRGCNAVSNIPEILEDIQEVTNVPVVLITEEQQIKIKNYVGKVITMDGA